MSKLNLQKRKFNTVFRQSTVVHPDHPEKMQVTEHSYITVPTIDTRGSWSIVRMVDEDTFVQMAILAGHVTPDARKRYAHSRKAAGK